MELVARPVIQQWIKENAETNDAIAIATDARSLRARLDRLFRGIFSDPRRVRAFFGRVSSLVNEDVATTVAATVPGVARGALLSKPKALAQFTTRNAGLIKGLASFSSDRVAKVVQGASGKHVNTLQREFQQAFGVTESRARLWARDQTLKLHAQITRERHLQLGIDRYYWTDSNDERVRDVHAELAEASDTGTTYDYKRPPIMSEDGRRGNPGEDYQCRCTAYPAL